MFLKILDRALFEYFTHAVKLFNEKNVILISLDAYEFKATFWAGYLEKERPVQ